MIERYVLTQKMHVGPLKAALAANSVLRWDDDRRELKIDGRPYKGDGDPGTAMDMLQRQADDHPREAWIRRLPDRDERSMPDTTTLTVPPVLGCLRAALQFCGEAFDVAADDDQREFLRRFGGRVESVAALDDVMASIANTDIKVVNQFLADHGFDIRLDPDPSAEFAVASVLDILVRWIDVANKTRLNGVDGGTFPAFMLKKGVSISFDADLHSFPVVSVKTTTDDVVNVSKLEDVPDGRFHVLDLVEEIRPVVRLSEDTRYDGVVMPMIDLDRQEDISYLCGMGSSGGNYVIGQAIQQTRFRMNEIGARAQSAAAMTMRCMSLTPQLPPHVIDGPFVLWIERRGFDLPVFAGVFCEDVWKEPKEL